MGKKVFETASNAILGFGTLELMEDKDDMPETPDLPPPVEEIDISGQKKYTKQRLKRRRGRKSTMLSRLGSTNTGKKGVLG